MKFYEFKNWILKKINVTLRLQAVFLFYIISLMVETRKHSITFASELSGVSMSSFSKFLLNNDDIAIYTLSDLSKTQAKQFSKIIEKIKSLPWKICIIIDDVFRVAAAQNLITCKNSIMEMDMLLDISGRILSCFLTI